jgi:hypothetical protein
MLHPGFMDFVPRDFFFLKGKQIAYLFFIKKEEYLQNRKENERKKKEKKDNVHRKCNAAEALQKKRNKNKSKNGYDLVVCPSLRWLLSLVRGLALYTGYEGEGQI